MSPIMLALLHTLSHTSVSMTYVFAQLDEIRPPLVCQLFKLAINKQLTDVGCSVKFTSKRRIMQQTKSPFMVAFVMWRVYFDHTMVTCGQQSAGIGFEDNTEQDIDKEN